MPQWHRAACSQLQWRDRPGFAPGSLSIHRWNLFHRLKQPKYELYFIIYSWILFVKHIILILFHSQKNEKWQGGTTPARRILRKTPQKQAARPSVLLTVVNFNIYRQTCQFTYFCDYTHKNGGRNLQIPSPVIIRKLYPYAALASQMGFVPHLTQLIN